MCIRDRQLDGAFDGGTPDQGIADEDVTEVDPRDDGGPRTTPTAGLGTVVRPAERPTVIDDVIEDTPAEDIARVPPARTVRPARASAPARVAPPVRPERTVARQPAALSIERANLSSGVFR